MNNVDGGYYNNSDMPKTSSEKRLRKTRKRIPELSVLDKHGTTRREYENHSSRIFSSAGNGRVDRKRGSRQVFEPVHKYSKKSLLT